MAREKASLLVSYIDDVCVDEDRSKKIKETKKRKRIEEAIGVAILQGDPKRAIDLSEKYNIPPQEFGKLVAKYTRFITK